MITAVDTSIILDILIASPKNLQESKSLLEKGMREGKLIVCPLVWGELRPFFKSDEEMKGILSQMNLEYDDFTPEVASLAGLHWKRYRENKGSRNRMLADFLIAAHAQLKADRFLTRDRGFYRTYFRQLSFLI